MYPQYTGYGPPGNYGQPQLQQPMQTGYPQPYGQQPQYAQGQPQQQRFLAPQQTGFAPGGLQHQQMYMPPQRTGYAPAPPPPPPPSLPPAPVPPRLPPSAGPMMAPPPPPVPNQGPSQYQQYGAPSPAPMSYQPTGLSAMPTGYGLQQLRASPSYVQPAFTSTVPMQMPSLFTSVFMPANPTMPYNNQQGMQFSHPAGLQGQSLQQTFQQVNVQQHGQAELKVPWALSTEERKNYDQIFRAWDQRGTGFISGQMAQEVFGQSGIDRDDLMKIWNLADVENRGKLNLAEFHVAMGLIYRRINGNPIPDSLPAELVPPSQRDLGTSVDFVKDLLRNDTTQRATASTPERYDDRDVNDEALDYRRARSLHEPARAGPSRKDATAYRHNDDAEPRTYKPSSRHLDRRNVRVRNGGDSPTSDLDDMRRALDQSQSALDGNRGRDDEADELREEREDLMHRIRQLQADIEHNSAGRRTEAKEAERRRLDRELDRLRYDKLPELERKMDAHKRESDQRRREAARKRDARNNASRFDDRDRYSSYDDERDTRPSERSYRDDDREGRSRLDDDGDRRSYRDTPEPRKSPTPREPSLQRSTPVEKPAARLSPPPPAPTVVTKAPSPAPSPAPPGQKSLGSMSADERKDYVRAEAARRVQTAMAKFGMPASSSGSVDPSVEERLEQDKRDAESRRNQADHEAAERERQRQMRLETEKLRDIRAQENNLHRADAALQQVSDAVTATESAQPQKTSTDASAVVRDEVDKAAVQLRDQETALQKEKQAREERIRRLQAEIDEAKRAEEEQEQNFRRNKEMFAAKSAPAPPLSRSARAAPPPAPPSRGQARIPSAPATSSTPSVAVSPPAAPTPPPAPPPIPLAKSPLNEPAAVAATAPVPLRSPASGTSTNPFHRMQNEPTPSAAPPGGPNPFSRAPTGPAAATVATPPPPSDDWDVGSNAARSAADSDDDEGPPTTRRDRAGLASALFGNIMPPVSRPSSAQASGLRSQPQSPVTVSTPSVAPPPPPPPAPQPSMSLPAAADTASVPLSSDGSRGAFLAQIQSGKSLKRAATNDRSGASVAGQVVGDAAMPPQTILAASPSQLEFVQSAPIGATSQGLQSDLNGSTSPLATHLEEVEVSEPSNAAAVPSNVDMTKTLRVFSLYPYANTSDREHVSFPEDVVLEAHPATDNTDWMYGLVETSGASGWFPSAYVQSFEVVKGRAIYSYTASSAIEADLEEGRTYNVVDRGNEGWSKVEQNGRVANAPAAYLEVEGGSDRIATPSSSAHLNHNGDEHDSVESDGASVSSEAESIAISPVDQREREIARQRILEAAGLRVQEQDIPSRRVPPRAPSRDAAFKNAPSALADESNSASRHVNQLDDAYDRYVRLQRAHSASAASTAPVSVAQTELLPEDSTQQLPAPQTALSNLQNQASSLLSWVASGMSRSASSPQPQSSITPVIKRIESDAAGPVASSRSWAGLIDPVALEHIPHRERERQEAMFELIQSEATFLSSLQQLVGTFFMALEPILPARAAQIIFSNVEQLVFFNATFLSELEEKQKQSRLLIDTVGDVVLRFLTVENLDLYRVYCANQANATETVRSLKTETPEIATVLQTLRVDGLEFEHFLLQPMQRLTRYPLLLNHILLYTDADSPDHRSLRRAIKLVEDALAATNESIKLQESDVKLRHLSQNVILPGTSMTIDLLAPSRLMGERRLLREGHFVRSRGSKRLDAYLCNDLLLLTTHSGGQDYVYKDPLPLEELIVKPGRDDLTLVLSYRGRNDKMRVGSARQCLHWQRDIRAAQDDVLAAMKMVRANYEPTTSL